MKENELEYRMYGLVPYNLSPIQQGIQFGHAVVEFAEKYFNTIQYRKWAEKDKTFIVLNGGTTNEKRDFDGIPLGSLNKHADSLLEKDITFSYFKEPDLGDQLTAIVFLVDERVWDKKKYPDFQEYFENLSFSERTKSEETHFEEYWKEKWVEKIGGEKNVWLRTFLSQFRFA